MLPLIIAYFWLIWVLTKNHFMYSSLAQEYDFKNTLSRAFYSYKNELLILSNNRFYPEQKINFQQSMIEYFYKLVIDNICKHPTERISKETNTPYSEILSTLNKILEKNK